MSDPALTSLANGLTAREVVSFESTEHLANLLRDASADIQTVVPLGGRGSLGTGHPATTDIAVDMTPNSGVLAYTPADLTLSVNTGTTWADLQATLAEHGQSLPLDIPHPGRTTVGGIVATGFAGARKYRNGSLRDLLIGCEYVRGDGLVARAGGMVVKNVSGFEIPRFLHGSWGSLAVVTSVNLKVMPKPRSEETVLQSFETLNEAVDAGLETVRSGQSVDSIAIVAEGTSATLAIRASGRPRAVTQIANGIIDASRGQTERLAEERSADWWQATTNAYAESDDVIQISLSVANEQLGLLAQGLRETVPSATMCLLVGSGSIRLRMPHGDLENSSENLAAALNVATQHGATWIIESAPIELRQGHAVWGQTDSGYTTMQAVKQSFDPANVLNRGRLFI